MASSHTWRRGSCLTAADSYTPSGPPTWSIRGHMLASLDSTDTVKVLDVISKAQYVPPDLLLFTRENTLWAQPFDISRMRLSGEPARVADGIAVMLANAVSGFSASENGVLVLAWDQTAALDMSWYDRTGKLLSQVAVGTFVGIDVSPDGKQVAAHRHDAASNGGDVSINDLERGTESRFTFEPSADNSSPIWSPDGKVIAFGAVRNGRWGLYRKAANSTGAEELLFESPTPVMPMTWSADGQTLVFASLHPKTLHDLWSLPLAGERKPTALVETVESDTHAQISPDGQWMSYRSGPELHVQRYPTGGQRYTVARGLISRWREDGRELFFNSSAGGGEIWTVAVEPIGDGLRFGTPRVLFDSRWAQLGHRPENLPYFTYAVSPDGERFLIPTDVANGRRAVACTDSGAQLAGRAEAPRDGALRHTIAATLNTRTRRTDDWRRKCSALRAAGATTRSARPHPRCSRSPGSSLRGSRLHSARTNHPRQQGATTGRAISRLQSSALLTRGAGEGPAAVGRGRFAILIACVRVAGAVR